MTKNMMGLPPGVTTTISGVALAPRRRAESSAIASRSSGMPGRRPVVGGAVRERVVGRSA